MFASTMPMSSAPMLPVSGSALVSPPSYDAIALNPNGPRSRTNLFVRKLASAVMEQDLKALFVPFGDILSFALMRDIHTGESLGTAFVRFATHEQAKTAMAALDGKPLYGRPISIQWAKRQHDSTPVGEARAKIRKLFVRNIPLDVTTRRLRQLFSPFGTIANVTVHADTAPPTHPNHMPLHSDPNTGVRSESVQEMHEENQAISGDDDDDDDGVGGSGTHDTVRNIAFVVFNEDGAANAAVEALHNTSPFSRCDGVPLMVKLAEDNRQRLERRMRFQDGSEANVHQASSSPSSPVPLQMSCLPNGINTVTAMPFMRGAPLLLPSGQAPVIQKGHTAGFSTTASAAAANVNPAAGGKPGAFMMNPASQAPPFTAVNGTMPGQYMLVAAPPGSSAASPTYWLQPMPSPTGASASPQSRSSTPSMVYAGGAQTTPPQTGTPPQSMRASPNFFVPMPANAFKNTTYPNTASSPNASGSAAHYVVSQSAAQSPCYGTGGLPMTLPLANGAMPGSSMHSHPSQFSMSPDSMSPRSDLSPRMGLSGRYAHPLSQSQSQPPQPQPWQSTGAMPVPQHMAGSNAFGPIRSPNSPVRGTPIMPGQSSPASRTGLSLPHAPLGDSYDGVAGGSVANSGQFFPSFSAAAMPTVMKPVPVMHSVTGHSFDYGNGMSLSSVRPRRVVDASGDQDVALTDFDPDTTYGSMRLENSANLIAPHFLVDLTGTDDGRAADDKLTDEADMTDEQLLELARNMALLEDDDCVNDYTQATSTR